MRNIDSYLDGESRGDTGGGYVIPQLPPAPPPAPIPVPTTIRTGGPLPPTPVTTTMQTGGPLPPTPVAQPVRTGGPLPPTPVSGNTGIVPPHLQTGGGLPPTPVQQPGSPINLSNFGPAQTVNDTIKALINGPIMENARQRGLETAATRGLMNSNIAAGSAQRAALESLQPYVSESMNLLNSREQRALTQNESALDRQFRQQLQNDSVLQQDWLASNAYNREFNGNLSLVPIANSAEFMQYLFQLGAQDPEVYTPNVLAGMQNFFTQSFQAMLQNFFPKGGS